jgi:elongation factor Ts
VNAVGNSGVVISLNCETDFVAKNGDFVGVAQTLLDLALSEGVASKDELLTKTFPGSSLTVADKITEEVGKIGERIEIGDMRVVSGDKVVAYIHPGNRLATAVAFAGEVSDEVGRDVAMQAAAMAPVAVDETSIPDDLIAKEREIGKDLAIQEGKPAEMAEKIAEGRLKKWFKEVTLVNQAFIKDNKQTVSQYVAGNGGGKVTSFARVALG